MKTWCEERGIIHEFSAPYSPSQNGVAERRQRTLVESARCMLLASGLPRNLWTEALRTAVHINNRSPTSALDGLTPHEKWFGSPPDIGYLRVFGCVSFGLVPKRDRRKLDPKGKKYALVGYGSHSKAYRLYDFGTQTVIERRDVVFDEATAACGTDHAGSTESDSVLFEILEPLADGSGDSDPDDIPRHTTGNHQSQGLEDHEDPDIHFSASKGQASEEVPDSESSDDLNCEKYSEDSDDQSSVRSEASDHAAAADPDTSLEVDEYEECETTDHNSVPDSSLAKRYSQQDSLWMRPGSLNSLQVQEPVTLEAALASPQAVEWQEAISSELHSMEQHGYGNWFPALVEQTLWDAAGYLRSRPTLMGL
jgi:hypothetical protein